MRKKYQQLRITYCREKLKRLPDIRCGHWKTVRGETDNIWIVSNGKRSECHLINSKRGQELLRLKEEADNTKRILSKLESEWSKTYNAPCESIKIRMFGNTRNKRLFDSYQERVNPMPFDSPVKYKNELYRSKLEADFARIMDDYGIPYKYEPGIATSAATTRYPDFIIYLPWSDLIILVEINGKCEDGDYLDRTFTKMKEYLLMGWMPGINMLSFYYNDKTPYVPERIMEEIENIELRNLYALTGT